MLGEGPDLGPLGRGPFLPSASLDARLGPSPGGRGEVRADGANDFRETVQARVPINARAAGGGAGLEEVGTGGAALPSDFQ